MTEIPAHLLARAAARQAELAEAQPAEDYFLSSLGPGLVSTSQDAIDQIEALVDEAADLLATAYYTEQVTTEDFDKIEAFLAKIGHFA
jgi:hypothetical protein